MGNIFDRLDNRIAWIDVEKELVSLVYSEISIIDKMLQSASVNYITSNRLFPYRELCFGFLVVARNNTEATLKLIEANLVDQIHFISRNTFEMMVILYYIDNDKFKRDELTQRFFDYHIVTAHRAMHIIESYPRSFVGVITEGNANEIKRDYDAFLTKYSQDGKKPSLTTWSGKNLSDMIDTISDENCKNDLMKRYKFMISANNYFLHPTELSLRQSILKYRESEISYKLRVKQIHSVLTSVDLIIHKYLEQFPKGRPAFKRELKDINNKHNKLVANTEAAGLPDSV
ncbi:MAG TPA: hypothetical protein DD713_06935 [Nitrospiraceae bacterium]|nr:hypothetical protein [Nitrospiraceae bacterium]